MAPVKVRNDVMGPDIIAGHNITSMRAHYDSNNDAIFALGKSQLFYYDVQSGLQTRAYTANFDTMNTEASKGSNAIKVNRQKEVIVSCNPIGRIMFMFTNAGRVIEWDMDQYDWVNQFFLPIKHEHLSLEAGLALNSHQFVFTILRKKNFSLNFAYRTNERESPKEIIIIDHIFNGSLNQFDSGPLHFEDMTSSTRGKSSVVSNSKILAYCNYDAICLTTFKEDTIFNSNNEKQTRHLLNDLQFTCVRCSRNSAVVAAGDTLGRVHVYLDNVLDNQNVRRVTLHWHSLPVSDLCFSSTGNLLYSVGFENGCVVIWNLSSDYIGQKQVIARLGTPIRFLNCANESNQLVLSFADNEIQFTTTNNAIKSIRTYTTQASKIYETDECRINSIGLLWHSQSNCLVSNGKLGQLQFFSPKTRSSVYNLDILNTDLLSFTRDCKNIPSDITAATFSLDGEWLAAYETREVKYMFPDVRLHIWRKKDNWEWIQTIERLHETTKIACLKFSLNNKYLLSVDADGNMNLLHRIQLDDNSNQMFARGYFGKFGDGGHIKCAFSNDSSVISASIKDECPYLWTIASPYKVVFTTQFDFSYKKKRIPIEPIVEIAKSKKSKKPNPSVEIYFGLNEHNSSIVDIRRSHIRVWDVICPEKACKYTIDDLHPKNGCIVSDRFIAAAFDYQGGTNNFAVCTKMNLILLFNLESFSTNNNLCPTLALDATLSFVPIDSEFFYTDLIFTSKAVTDCKIANTSPELRTINRLCMLNAHGEVVSFNDRIDLDKRSSIISSNIVKSCDSDNLKAYFSAMGAKYADDQKRLYEEHKVERISLTAKQQMIRSKLEVKKLLKDVILRVPSHILPPMDTLAPMILDKLLKHDIFEK